MGESLGPSDSGERLQALLHLAHESLPAVRRVSLHLRAGGMDRLELSAVSGGVPEPAPARYLRLSDPLVARVLAADAPVLATEEGHPRRTRVLARVVGRSGTAIGVVTVELDGAGPAERSLDVSERGRLTALSAMVAQAVGALTQVGDLARANASLRARAAVDARLAAVAHGTSGGLLALVRESAALTGKHVTLFDDEGRQLTAAHPGSSTGPRCPGIHQILAVHGPVAADSTAAFMVTAAGGVLTRRKVVAPVFAAGEKFGWLVVDEHPAGFRALDTYVAERAAAHVGAEFLVQRRVARVAWNAKTSLARQMVRGTQVPKDLVASAEYLGVDTLARRVVAYVLETEGSRSDDALDQELAAELEQELGVEVLATRGSEGILLLVEAREGRGATTVVADVKSALVTVAARLRRSDLIAGVSSACEPAALSRGYREAREVAHCIDRFVGRGGQRVLAVDDLGPARLFLANSESSAVRGYVADVLGPLLTGDPGTADLLVTLQCYFEASRSVRASAAHLGVHENTIRLRLARVATATGLDVAGDANDQLSVQTALLVLRLKGHPALLPFGAGRDAGGRDEDAASAPTASALHGRRGSATERQTA